MRTALSTIRSATSGAVNVTSTPLGLNQIFSYGIAMMFTGTLAGTATLEASLDYARDAEGNVTNTGTWSEISGSEQEIQSGDRQIIWNVSGANYPYVRAVWTADSGTGNVTVISFIRGF